MDIYYAVDENGDEVAFFDYPIRIHFANIWASEIGGFVIPKGTIEKNFGKKLTWADDPIKEEV